MLTQIVSNTPRWVWALLFALMALGASQLFSRVASRARVVRMSLFMTAFSLYGTVSAFGPDLQVLACWLAAASAVGYSVLRIPLGGDTRYLPERRAFELPGSWVPLALMVGIFLVKYAVGVMMAMHLPVVRAALFGPMLGLLYGAFSGVFLGRAGRLVVLAKQAGPVPLVAQSL